MTDTLIANPPETAPNPYAKAVIRTVTRRLGARLGIGWILILVVLAVFAPFLANSRPLLMKSAGQWSSPALRALAPADVLLLVAFCATAALWPTRWRPSTKMIAWSAVMVLAAVPAL